MKIYIKEFAPKNVKHLLSDLLTKQESYIQLYTSEGIYAIYNNQVYALESKDGEIKIVSNYVNNIDLIVDYSYFTKKKEMSVFGNKHVQENVEKYVYKLNKQSKVSFVLETQYNLESEFMKEIVYFESNENIHINELFVRQEIIEFLSLLN